MAVRAVVFDIGGVLEVIDDSVFPGAWPARLGLTRDEFDDRLGGLPGDPVVGEVTEECIRRHWRQRLGLDDAGVDALLETFWAWYAGTLDQSLFDWYAGQRPVRRTGILSNSGPGARERERHHGFEPVTDVLVYSHEVGLKKPDRRAFDLTTRLLGVAPHEVLFLDDVEANIEAARAVGWHAVLHRDTATSIRLMEQVIALQAAERAQPAP